MTSLPPPRLVGPADGPDRTVRFGRWCCIGGATFGALGLVGWLSGIGLLSGNIAGEPPMMPNTALGLLLVGIAGALRARPAAEPATKAASRFAAFVALVLAVATLAEYAFAVDLGIDDLLFHLQSAPHPGRPSPLTAVALASLSAGILVFDTRPAESVRPSEGLILAGGVAGLTGLIGYAFGARPLYLFLREPVIGVALPTAIGLLLIAVGLVLERPTAGVMRVAMSRGPGGVLLRRLVVPAFVTPIVLGVIVTRLFAALRIGEPSIAVAILVSTASAASLLFLILAAAPLNRAAVLVEQSRMRTRDLVELAPDGIFVADLEGRYTDVNDAGCRLLGYERADLIGKSIADLLPPDQIDRLWRSKGELLEGGPSVAEWSLRRRDGSFVPVEVSAKILPDGRWQGFVRDITERQRARDELRQAQERFELALRGADLAAWDWNIQSGEVVFNARWAEMRGFRLDEVRGHVDSWIAGIHPEDLAGVKQRLDAYLRGAAADYECECRVRGKAGQWIWILDRGKVFARNERGEPTRMVGTELDITARKRAEAELQRAEAKATGILSISADAIISVDAEQRITMFNEGAERIFGYAKAEAIGAPLDLLIPVRYRDVHRRHLQRFAEGQEVARRMGDRGSTIFGLRKNGEEFPADAAISRLSVAGTPILTVTLRDITVETRIEFEQRFLAEVGPLLETGLDYEQSLIAIARLAIQRLADVCIVDVVEETGGVRRLEVVTRDRAPNGIRQALMGAAPDGRPGPAAAVVDQKKPVLMPRVTPELLASWAQDDDQARVLRAAGPLSAIAVPLLAHDVVLGVLTMLSTAGSAEYGPADLPLAEEVARRAALSVENSRLYRAARRAIRERDDVLGIVAHDLRNPLSAIVMNATALSRQAARAGAAAYKPAQAIERAAVRMNRLIQDLLDTTRLDAGQLAIERERLPPGRVIADAVEAHRPQAASAACELRAALDQELADVWADRDRLLQVFDNLIGNALKFTGPGGQITVRAKPRDGDVLFSVSDTGCGLTADEVTHLFDRFWQAKKKDRRGAGLGLPIVKGIVEAHGGRIWVESTPGRGSTFFFTLPAVTGQPARFTTSGSGASC